MSRFGNLFGSKDTSKGSHNGTGVATPSNIQNRFRQTPISIQPSGPQLSGDFNIHSPKPGLGKGENLLFHA